MSTIPTTRRRTTLVLAAVTAVLAGCSATVHPFPTLATAATSQELGVTADRVLHQAVANELDRDGDGRLDVTAPLRHGIPTFDDEDRIEFVVDGTTVCVDGPAGVVTSGGCP